ncbi:DUF3095 domain-containing protein [Myxococcota bacterium]|nr:DUF3095 domain-containing protein [Myxococcota bacterium]
MASSARFYADLPAIEAFAEVVDPARHAPVPPDWCIALTDVRGSTAAIEAGRYKDVNALGAASIVAVRNAAPELDLPFVFGGDGATLLFPQAVRPAVEGALRGVRALARERFDLELRVGVVPVDQLLDQGHPVRVARYRPSPHVCLAMLSGAGVPEAERRIKDPEQGPALCLDGPGKADLAGFECRWEPLSSRNGVVLSLLVQAVAPTAEERSATYRAVLADLDALLGDVAHANPAHPVTLHIASAPAAFEQEARLRGGRSGVPYLWHRLQARSLAQVGRLLLATGWRIPGFDGARYRDEVVQNTDFRKFDDTLRMVVDVSEAQHQAIRSALEAAQARGELAFGIHVSSAALMTCLISSHEGDHVHFVDGADGGYAMAARPLKARLKAAL